MPTGTREDIDGQLASLGWGTSHRTRTIGKRGLSEDTWHVETLKTPKHETTVSAIVAFRLNGA